MRPPRPPREPGAPKPPRPAKADAGRAKSPANAARDARRAQQHAMARGKPAAPIAPARAVDAKPNRGVKPVRAAGPARSKAAPPAPPSDPPVRQARRGAQRLQRVPAAPRRETIEGPVAPGAGQRIAKLLARAGIASRREIERMIADGRVAIAGVAVETPATILRSLASVTVDGQPMQAALPTLLFRYHKPPGLLTAERDPKGRLTIYDRLPPDLPRLMPVGRLDLNTEGLLLLTTDGEFKRQLELPKTGVERTYRARVFGPISQDQLEELIEGVEIEGIRYGSIDANLERRTGRNAWVEIRLREGKNREVRRVLEFLGLQVSRLIRTAYGPFRLDDLPMGAVDEVRQHELVAFRKTLVP